MAKNETVSIKPVKIESSFIKAAKYDSAEKTLEITFKGRPVSVVGYHGVGTKTYQNFLSADSKGTFFNSKIKGKYAETVIS